MDDLNIINKTDDIFLNNELIYEQVNLKNKISAPILTKYENYTFSLIRADLPERSLR